jgi:hypothetical protein
VARDPGETVSDAHVNARGGDIGSLIARSSSYKQQAWTVPGRTHQHHSGNALARSEASDHTVSYATLFTPRTSTSQFHFNPMSFNQTGPFPWASFLRTFPRIHSYLVCSVHQVCMFSKLLSVLAFRRLRLNLETQLHQLHSSPAFTHIWGMKVEQ